VLPDDAVRHAAAKKEIVKVVAAFKKSQSGQDESHLVPATRIADRLDVKSCVLKPGRKVDAWKKLGVDVGKLSQWVQMRDEKSKAAPDEVVELLSISYDGFPERQPTVRETIDYSHLYTAHTNDIVVSHINAVNGAIGVLPKDMDGAVVSPEYTVLTPLNGVDPYAVWAILRSPEVRAELLTRSSGLGRHRIKSPLLLDELVIPSPQTNIVVKKSKAFHDALKLEAEAARLRQEAQSEVEVALGLRSETADNIIAAFKPPR
jgi:type I restriction enzyme M protein